MVFLKVVTIGFLILESLNVVSLYFSPGTKRGNAVGVFKAWEKSKEDPEMHDFAKYMVNWVAGTKLIFILLLIVILVMADENTLLFAGIAMAVSILTFYWRLFPLIKKMDREDQIDPPKYSQQLGWMIAVFVLMFVAAVVVGFIS